MADLQDYEEWHAGYDDPASGLPWRLARVQAHLVEALDQRPGVVRLLSACAGDGRDVIGVLSRRPDAARVTALPIELHPGLAQRACDAAVSAGLSGLVVRTGDAGSSDAYAGAVPADIVVLVGILGNISEDDLWRVIDASPQLCAPGAALIWSRGRDEEDLNLEVRARFTAAGFTELGTRPWMPTSASVWAPSATTARPSTSLPVRPCSPSSADRRASELRAALRPGRSSRNSGPRVPAGRSG